jgi:hypothetical protein
MRLASAPDARVTVIETMLPGQMRQPSLLVPTRPSLRPAERAPGTPARPGRRSHDSAPFSTSLLVEAERDDATPGDETLWGLVKANRSLRKCTGRIEEVSLRR